MHTLFSTVLFVDGHPVRYEMTALDGSFRLFPAENPNPDLSPPVLCVGRSACGWIVRGTTDPDLLAQVLEDLQVNGARMEET